MLLCKPELLSPKAAGSSTRAASFQQHFSPNPPCSPLRTEPSSPASPGKDATPPQTSSIAFKAQSRRHQSRISHPSCPQIHLLFKVILPLIAFLFSDMCCTSVASSSCKCWERKTYSQTRRHVYIWRVFFLFPLAPGQPTGKEWTNWYTLRGRVRPQSDSCPHHHGECSPDTLGDQECG